MTRATGPVTIEGKEIVAKNAIKHGLLSKEILIPNENAEELANVQAGLVQAIAPEGSLEELLVDRIVSSWWRLRRIIHIEKDMMSRITVTGGWTGKEANLGEKFSDDCKNNNTYLKLMRYENSIQRGLFRALHELARLQMIRAGEHVPAPVTVAVDLNCEQNASQFVS